MATEVAGTENDQITANSAFAAIDRGLLSGKVSDVVESIVKFPALFDRHPFPLLINSSILKLAEAFRVGSNFTRLCILRVCQQSERHANKIVNVDEVVARLFSVTYSNDPVARSLVLRVFGTLSAVIPERQEVRHNIRRALDSNDTVELHAAVWAAQRFVAVSPSFAADICAKIAAMVESVAIPTHTKLQLFSVLEHMCHDTERVIAVRQLCVDMLPCLPAERFVIANLRVLTKLAANTLIDIPLQVELLLQYLTTDVRLQVRLAALVFLHHLAARSALLWSSENERTLTQFAASCSLAQLVSPALCVLTTLCRQLVPAHQSQLLEPAAQLQLVELCQLYAYHCSTQLAVRAVQLYTVLAVNSADSTLTCAAVTACESLLLLLLTKTRSPEQTAAAPGAGSGGGGGDQLLGQLAATLRCARALAVHAPGSQSAVQLVDSLWSLCRDVTIQPAATGGSTDRDGTVTSLDDGRGLLLLECLCAVAQWQPQLVMCLQSDVLQLLRQLSAGPTSYQLHVVRLCTLLFEMREPAAEPWSASCLDTLVDGATRLSAWRCYQVARQAMRFGQHCVALRLLRSLRRLAASPHTHHWLTALWRVTRAESLLARHTCATVVTLSTASLHYSRALNNVSASCSTHHYQNMSFAVEFCQLRWRWLQCHTRLQSTCGALQTSPPPCVAIAATAAGDSDQSDAGAAKAHSRWLRSGRVLLQLQCCRTDFIQLADQYQQLYRRSFDADASSLLCLRALQHACHLVVDAVNWVVSGQSRPEIGRPADVFVGQCESALHAIRDACSRARATLDSAGSLVASAVAAAGGGGAASGGEWRHSVCHHHISALVAVSGVLSAVPVPVPRRYFQSFRTTTITLSLQPQPRALADPVILHPLSSHLTVKVDGVISYGSGGGGGGDCVQRQVVKTRLTVVSKQQTKPQPAAAAAAAAGAGDNKVRDCSIKINRVVQPRNDFFHEEFLLNLSSVGVHQICVQVEAIDAWGNSWSMASDQLMSVRVFDETVTSSVRRQQTGAATSSSAL